MGSMIYAPHYSDFGRGHPSIFLAGSLEMGQAVDWQDQIGRKLMAYECVVFNPRRKDWDSSWVQAKDNPEFRRQVQWEVEHLHHADIIAVYFAPGTVSPITLLELGLFMARKPVIYCPTGFARKGNVDITAERYGVPVYETEDAFLKELGERIATYHGY
jgi:hypothetical protein